MHTWHIGGVGSGRWFTVGQFYAFRQFRDFRGFYAALNGIRWHVLVAVYLPIRFGFVVPAAKPDYRRLYLGVIEIEWSKQERVI